MSFDTRKTNRWSIGSDTSFSRYLSLFIFANDWTQPEQAKNGGRETTSDLLETFLTQQDLETVSCCDGKVD